MKGTNQMNTKEQFITAYTELSEDIFRYFWVRIHNKLDSKDMAQETFIRVWKYLQKGKNIDNFRPFVYKTAYNLIIDNSKKKQGSSLDELHEKGFDVKEDKISSQDWQDYLASLQEMEKLDKQYKEIMFLRYVDELQVKDIALVLNLSENLVSVRINRALKQLRINIEK